MAKPKRRDPGTGTPIRAKKEALDAEQDLLRTRMRQLEVLIEEAPEKKKKQAEERREKLIRIASRSTRPINTETLVDRRYETTVAAALPRGRRKSLKSERRQARLTFFVLVILLALLSLWVWSIWH